MQIPGPRKRRSGDVYRSLRTLDATTTAAVAAHSACLLHHVATRPAAILVACVRCPQCTKPTGSDDCSVSGGVPELCLVTKITLVLSYRVVCLAARCTSFVERMEVRRCVLHLFRRLVGMTRLESRRCEGVEGRVGFSRGLEGECAIIDLQIKYEEIYLSERNIIKRWLLPTMPAYQIVNYIALSLIFLYLFISWEATSVFHYFLTKN